MKKNILMGAFLVACALAAQAQTTTTSPSGTNQSQTTGVTTYPDPQSVPSAGGDNAAQGVQSGTGAKKAGNRESRNRKNQPMNVTTYPDPQSVPSSGGDDAVLPGSNTPMQSGRVNRPKSAGKTSRRRSTMSADTTQR